MHRSLHFVVIQVSLAIVVLLGALYFPQHLGVENQMPPALQSLPNECYDLTLLGSVPGFRLGVLNDLGNHYDDEWQRGLRATNLEFNWSIYEPQEGIFDQNYINRMRELMISLKTKGWYVQMIPGFHYTPQWVFDNYGDMYFVNQYGDRYDPSPDGLGHFRVSNAPFNPQARLLISRYLARIFQDFDQNDPLQRFDSVRVGGGVQGELRYPPPNWNGHNNSFWAYDNTALDRSKSNIPDDVRGWKAGVDPNPGEVGHGQLLANPGFELAHADLPILAWSPDDGIQASVVESDSHSGGKALQLTLSGRTRIHQYIDVKGGTTYEFGGWVKALQPGSLARIFVTQLDASMRPFNSATLGQLSSSSQDWTQVQGGLTTVGKTRYLKVELDGSIPGSYRFDDLFLRRKGEADMRDRDLTVPLDFYDWYVATLTNYQNWQISELRKYTKAPLDITYAGKGLRFNQMTDALTTNFLSGNAAEASSALFGGTIYQRHVDGLPNDPNLAIYLTGIEDPPPDVVDDSSPYPGRWSAAHWLASLAEQRNLDIWGENSGQDTPAELKLSIERAKQFGFSGLLWGFETELYANSQSNPFATIDHLSEQAAMIKNNLRASLPFCNNKRVN